MLVYEKKVLEEEKLKRHLFGTLGNIPSEDDEQLVYKENDGDIIYPVENDLYFDDKHHGIIRKSDGKHVNVFIKTYDPETQEEILTNIIPGQFQPTPSEITALNWVVPPVKTSYTEGDMLDLAGGIVEATYSDGDKKNVTIDCVFTPAESSILTVNDTKVTAAFGGLTAVQAITVVEAPPKEVTTPEELAEAIAKGGKVKVMADMTTQVAVAEGKEVSLDLGGHTITNSGAAIVNNGTLTITNTANAEGKLVSTSRNAIQINTGSKTVIESGEIEAKEFAIASVRATGAHVEINGGTFTTTDNCVIGDNGTDRDGDGNTFIINDGTFNGNIVSEGYIACGIYAPWKDTVTINGGTFNINNGVGICARAGQTTVNGGTFNCSGTGTGKVGDSANQVPAGTGMFFDEEAHYPAHLETDFIKAKGGIFSSIPDTKYIAEGYEAVEIGEGKYEIRPIAASKKKSRR